MTARERYIAAILFGKPDRAPFYPGNGRKSTIETWHSQGLPEEVTDYHSYVCEQLGIPWETVSLKKRVHPGISFKMIPEFEEKVIEKRSETLIVQDWKGNVCEISDRYDVTYLRKAMDFVTRRWIKCPVESREDWNDRNIRQRYVHSGL